MGGWRIHRRAAAAIAWAYPMVPWAGRIRHGTLTAGRIGCRSANGHAIHGLGFSRPWQIDRLDAAAARLSLALRATATGAGHGHAGPAAYALQMRLSVQAGEQAMPAVLGWHPWFPEA